jgi:PKD repeat protein
MKTISLPLYIFSAAVLLIAGCDCGKDPAPSTKPDAEFTVSGYELPVPATLQFINTSKNTTSYVWDFGDGTSSTTQNPSHQYNAIGTYLMRLKATGPEGSDSICKLITLDVITTNKSSFSYFFDKCSGTPVNAAFRTLNPASMNTVWDFGNGVINISRDPIVQFLVPGDYTIKYSSMINGIRDTVIRMIRID